MASENVSLTQPNLPKPILRILTPETAIACLIMIKILDPLTMSYHLRIFGFLLCC